MTRQELIDFLDGGETEETKLEAGTNHIATTNGVLNWITSLNRSEVSAKQIILRLLILLLNRI